MKKTTLYKVDSKNKIREWSIEVLNHGDYSEVNIVSGLVDGKKVEQSLAVREGKNLGKNNQTTPYTQAVSEAESRIEQQVRQGYVTDISQVRDSGTLGTGLRSPMLAVTFDPHGQRKNSKTLKQLGLENKLVGIQRKLDGNRMLVVIKDGKATAYTRKGDIMPVQPIHILNSLELSYNDPTYVREEVVVVDGEILHPNMTFNESNGLLKRFKNHPDEKVLSEYEYHIYDMVLQVPYKERYNILSLYGDSNKVKLVETEYITAKDDILKAKLGQYVAEGNEGLMIRNLEMPYEHKRSKGLIKYKDFMDEEFILVGMEEDARGGFVGNFILAMNEFSEDANGKPITTFKAGTTGMSQDELKQIWNNQENYIGNKTTVEYFELSEYKVPRFGKVKELNRTDI